MTRRRPSERPQSSSVRVLGVLVGVIAILVSSFVVWHGVTVGFRNSIQEPQRQLELDQQEKRENREKWEHRTTSRQ